MNLTVETERTPAETPAEIAMKKQMRQLAQMLRVRFYLLATLDSFAVLLFVIAWIGSGSEAGQFDLFLVWGLPALAGDFLIRCVTRTLRTRAIETLARSATVRSIPLLTGMYDIGALEDSIERLLIRLLPRLQASDAHLLTTACHTHFNLKLASKKGWLNRNPAPLLCAILKAYEQAGNKQDLAVVERVANGKDSGAGDLRIRTAAQECLPYLRVRAEEQESAANAASGVKRQCDRQGHFTTSGTWGE